MTNPRKRKAAIKEALAALLDSDNETDRRKAHDFMGMPIPEQTSPADVPDEEWVYQKAVEMGVLAEEKKTATKKIPSKKTTTKKSTSKKSTSKKKTTGKSKS